MNVSIVLLVLGFFCFCFYCLYGGITIVLFVSVKVFIVYMAASGRPQCLQ